MADATAKLDDDQIAELAEMFRMMGDQSRLGILLACMEAPVSVGGIAQRLGLSPSLVSHHLRLLRAGRLVRASRHGKQVFYTVDDDHIRSVLTDMAEHVGELGLAGAAVRAVEAKA